jgi:hypothetical protein
MEHRKNSAKIIQNKIKKINGKINIKTKKERLKQIKKEGRK